MTQQPALDPLQQLMQRSGEAQATRPDSDPVIDVRVALATGEESYDAAQVERALMHEKPERVTVFFIIGGDGTTPADDHDLDARKRAIKTQLPGR